MYPLIEFSVLGESFALKTYSLFLAFAVILGITLSYPALKRKVAKPLLLLVGLTLTFLVGARLLNFAVNFSAYQTPELNLFTLKAVGFSLYGGVLASISLLLALHYLHKIDIWKVADALVLPFGLCFFVMRIGCFFNGCCFGEITACPLGVPLPPEAIASLPNSPALAILQPALLNVHPTQLYEGVAALVGVIVFYLLRRRFKVKGLLAVYYGIYLTIVRWIVFYFRYFEYQDWVVDYFYPLLYLFLIGLGVFLSIYLIKKRKTDST